jgi:hypothetical protein
MFFFFFFIFINAIKKACKKHLLLKQHMFLTCQWTHVNLICGLYEISYNPVCRKFLSGDYYNPRKEIKSAGIIKANKIYSNRRLQILLLE